ncbi:MAG: hypothetical protein Q7S92_03930, partial [Candidatus Diapherotrites archaeon]|nr:hypothetical protein [Candidatus Diapherotrites archaeon]
FTVGKIIDVVIESNGCLQLTAPEDYNFNFLETAEQPGTFLNTCRDQINALMYPAFTSLMYPAFTWHFDSSVGLNVLDPLPQDAYYCFMDGSAELKATAFPGFKYPGDFAVYSETPAESLITDISSSVPVPFEEGPTQVWVDDGMGLQYSVTPNRVFSALDREVQANMYSQRNSNPINFSNVTGIIDFTNQFIGENSNIFDSVLDRFMDVFNQNVGINTVLNYSAYNQLHDLFVEKLKQKVAAKFMLSNNCVIDSMLNNVVDGPLFTNAFNTKLRSLDLANYNPGLPENQITSEVCDNIINTADNCYYREGQCEAHCRQEDSCLDQCEREFKTCMQPLADQYFPIDQSLPIDQRVLDRDQQVHKVEELYSFCQSVNRIVTNLDEISSNIETVFAELNPEMDQVASNFVNRLNSKFRTLNASFTVSDLIPSKVSTGEANSFAASELQLTALTEFNDGLLRSYNSNIGPYFDSSAFEGIWIHLQDRIDNLFESLQPQSCSYFNLRNSFSNYVKQEVSAQLQAGLTQGENRTQPQQSVYVTIYNDNSQSFDHFLENFVEDMDYAYGLENDSYLMKDIAVEIISDNPDIAYDFGIDAVYARYTGENICPNTPVNISNVNFTLTNYGLTKDEYADLEISDAITQTGRTYTDIIDNEPDLEGVVQ